MLTGKQLKTIRQVANFTEQDVADQMYVSKKTIIDIETNQPQTLSNVRYYYLSLRIMISEMDDTELQAICWSLFNKYEEES